VHLNALKILYCKIYQSDSFIQETDDTLVITQLIYQKLWNYPMAIDEGFALYIKRRTKEIEDALRYHARNCDSPCIICSDLEKIGV